MDQMVNLLGRRAVLPRGENRKLLDGVEPERVAPAKITCAQGSHCCCSTSVAAVIPFCSELQIELAPGVVIQSLQLLRASLVARAGAQVLCPIGVRSLW